VQLLQPSWEADGRPFVAEVALDLAGDGQRGEGCELVPKVRIEPFDRLDQPEIPDLHDVVQRLAAVLKLPRQEVDEVAVGVNELRANAIAFCGIGRLFVATVERAQLLAGRSLLGSHLL